MEKPNVLLNKSKPRLQSFSIPTFSRFDIPGFHWKLSSSGRKRRGDSKSNEKLGRRSAHSILNYSNFTETVTTREAFGMFANENHKWRFINEIHKMEIRKPNQLPSLTTNEPVFVIASAHRILLPA